MLVNPSFEKNKINISFFADNLDIPIVFEDCSVIMFY